VGIDNNFTGSIPHIPSGVRYIVTGEWLQKCVDYNERLDEDPYLYISHDDSFEADSKVISSMDYAQLEEELQTQMKESVGKFIKNITCGGLYHVTLQRVSIR